MSRYLLTRTAEAELEELLAFIAEQDGRGRAEHVLVRFLDAFENLAASPGIGHHRRLLTGDTLRWWPVFRFLVLYDPKAEPLTVMRPRFAFGIILVTGRTDDVDRIVGLEMGADDYVTKPFNQRELLARVKNLLRRTARARPEEERPKQFGAWTFDLRCRAAERRRRLRRGLDPGRVRIAFRLRAASRRRHEPRSPAHASHAPKLGPERSDHRRSGERRLRQKLEQDPKAPELIVTAHGEGYLFAAEVTLRAPPPAGAYPCNADQVSFSVSVDRR